MLHPILKDKLQQVTALLKEHKVKRAYAFGSVCTDRFNDDSDIDFLIAFEDEIDPLVYGNYYFEILFALEKLFKREIDLVTEASLRNPYFIKVMNKTKTPLYE
jgi:predicted nucleotidyltransferase